MQVQRLLFLLLHFAGHIHIISSSYETRLGVEKHHHLTPGQESVGFSENILLRFDAFRILLLYQYGCGVTPSKIKIVTIQ